MKITTYNKELNNFLKNKNVAVVFNDNELQKTNNIDEIIDSYDVVVRLNKAFPVPVELTSDIGRKTDILYNCLNNNKENGGAIDLGKAKKNLKWIGF